MIPHLAWSVISTVKTNFIIWKILKIVLLPRNPWQHIAYLKLNQPKIKATKFPQKIVCGNATDTALYISANGNAAETLRKRETRPHFALTCFRPPEMWRKLEPSDFRKISEIRKRLISPCVRCTLNWNMILVSVNCIEHYSGITWKGCNLQSALKLTVILRRILLSSPLQKWPSTIFSTERNKGISNSYRGPLQIFSCSISAVWKKHSENCWRWCG